MPENSAELRLVEDGVEAGQELAQHAANILIVNELLTIHKQESEIVSEARGTLVNLGNIKDIIKGAGNWVGGITVAGRLASNDPEKQITADEVAEFKKATNKYYVPVTKNAPKRCMDGRTLLGYIDSKVADYVAELGPQVPGGTIGDAIAYRHVLVMKGESLEGATLSKDIASSTEPTLKIGATPGIHGADHHGVDDCGCGAIDKDEVAEQNVAGETVTVIQLLAQQLLGDSYNQDHLNDALGSIETIQGYSEYFQTTAQVVGALLKENANGQEMLTGSHNEVVFNVNLVPGTTYHRDHSNALTNDRLQAFNYDFWDTLEMAEAYFPDSAEDQSRFIHARLALAISTLMLLVDEDAMDIQVRMPSGDTRSSEEILAQSDYELAA